MPVLDPMIHQLWLERAAKGNPPDPVQVLNLQYGLDTPWHIRQNLLAPLKRVGKGNGKARNINEVSRGGAKSMTGNASDLYLAEYVIPFLPKARPENKRVIIIGRTETHVSQQDMTAIDGLVSNYAPWLKTSDQALWSNPSVLQDTQIRTRAWTRTEKTLTNGVSIRGYGLDQSIRGEHVYRIRLDDVLDESNFNFGQEQAALISGAIEPAVEPGGSLQVDGTPQGDNDVYDILRQDSKWEYSALPAIDETGELGYRAKNALDIKAGFLKASAIVQDRDWDCLWPARLNYAYLEAERGTSRDSELKFQREYLLRRVIDSSLLVHPDHIARAKDPTLFYAQAFEGAQTYGGIDPSTLREDNAAVMVGYVGPNNTRIPLALEVIPASGQDPLILLDLVMSLDRRFAMPKWRVEQNGYQGILKSLLAKERPEMLGRVETQMLTTIKHQTDGFPLIRTMFEAGKIKLPYGPTPQEAAMIAQGRLDANSIDAVKRTNELVEELRGIRIHDGKIVEDPKRKNDRVSALYFWLRECSDSSGFSDIKLVPVELVAPEPSQRDPEFDHPMIGNERLARVREVYNSHANRLRRV